jgi:hypothetical protein
LRVPLPWVDGPESRLINFDLEYRVKASSIITGEERNQALRLTGKEVGNKYIANKNIFMK